MTGDGEHPQRGHEALRADQVFDAGVDGPPARGQLLPQPEGPPDGLAQAGTCQDQDRRAGTERAAAASAEAAAAGHAAVGPCCTRGGSQTSAVVVVVTSAQWAGAAYHKRS